MPPHSKIRDALPYGLRRHVAAFDEPTRRLAPPLSAFSLFGSVVGGSYQGESP